MSQKLFLELVSPEKQLISQEVDEIYAPGAEGDLGVLPGHTTFFCALREGELHFTVGNETEYVALDGGFLEVKDNKVTILADGAELGGEINLDELIRRKVQTEKELDDARHKDTVAYQALEARLKRELVRINVAGRYQK